MAKVVVKNIESLEHLRVAILRFCESSERELYAIDSKIQTRINTLISVESKFTNAIEYAKDNLKNAKRDFSNCKANTHEDEDGYEQEPDCDFEQEEVYNCQKKLAKAENNYNSFKREISRLKLSIDEYQKPKVKYKSIINWEREAAPSSLKQLINGAEDYLSVTSPLGNGLSNGFGLTEAIAKIDPAMIVAATVGVAEIMMMSVFSFLGLGGNLFSVSNKKKNGIVTTAYTENGTEHICSELKIEKRESGNFGKILSVNIPPILQTEKIGKHLVGNMEATCRANDCKEINGWTNTNNIPFYKGLGYETRNEIKETGCEVFKPLESGFFASQQNAKAAFQNLNNAAFISSKNLGKQQVNPLNVISPDEMNDEKFWNQHGENQTRYFDLIEKYEKCDSLLKQGKTLDEIRKEDSWVANAHDVFHGSEPIRLLKSGDYYKIDSNGRHRVAAAQLYYMQTGKTINLTADVFEKN